MFFLGPLYSPLSHFRLSSLELKGEMGSFPNKASGARVHFREFTVEICKMGTSGSQPGEATRTVSTSRFVFAVLISTCFLCSSVCHGDTQIFEVANSKTANFLAGIGESKKVAEGAVS